MDEYTQASGLEADALTAQLLQLFEGSDTRVMSVAVLNALGSVFVSCNTDEHGRTDFEQTRVDFLEFAYAAYMCANISNRPERYTKHKDESPYDHALKLMKQKSN